VKRPHIPRPRPTKRPRITPEMRPPEVPDEHGVTRNVRAMCTARRTDGEPCRAYAVAGASVCSRHGGLAPQVRRAAAVRLAMSSDWLVEELLKIAKSADDEKTKLLAINSALDRVGLGTRSTVEIEAVTRQLAPYEEQLRSALTRVVRVYVDADGHESTEDGRGISRLGGGRVGMIRPSGSDDTPAIESAEIIDAEVVDDAAPNNVVRMPATPRAKSSMLLPVDLQEGKCGERPPSRGKRNTASEFNP
jgi:hypothetical protein